MGVSHEQFAAKSRGDAGKEGSDEVDVVERAVDGPLAAAEDMKFNGDAARERPAGEVMWLQFAKRALEAAGIGSSQKAVWVH